MPRHRPLSPRVECLHLEAAEDDWIHADRGLLETMLVHMRAIRSFEEAILRLAQEGLVHGPAHSSIGQEAAAVGSVLALRNGDGVNGTHRGHHQFLSKALQYLSPEGIPVSDALKRDEHRELLHRTLGEILGLRIGFSGGRGGSMHLQWHEAGALGTNAIVGGGVPLAAGNALAQKYDGTEAASGDTSLSVTVTYFGDGAANIGSTLETLNLAAAWRLPMGFFVENNQYAVSTHISEVTGEEPLVARGPGFGIRSWQVDGMDPLAVYLAQREAIAHMRAGRGPTLIEALTYRFFHQNGPFPGSAFGYRSKEEEQQWKQRDPITALVERMTSLDILTQEQDEELRASVEAQVASVVDELLEETSSSGGRRIRAELLPDTDSVDAYIRSDAAAGSILQGHLLPDSPPAEEEVKFSDAIAAVLAERMEQDPGVIVLGEDVHRLKGGTNGATKDLTERFPERTLGTPISENAFTGLAGGLSMTGRYKPVVEFMYSDFLWVAADQVFNQIAKARHMYGGQTAMPVVLRSKVAMGTGYGSQHSMDPAGIFATSAGWRIVAPSTASDYIGLMNTALDLDDPVLVLEHVDLYPQNHHVPEGDRSFRLPLGKAAVRRPGSDVTVLSYLNLVQRCVTAADRREDLDPEVIDLRWLDRASLDWETIGGSIRRCNSVLIVEQGTRGTSYGGWLADEIQRRYFDYLDQPVQRVTGGEASPSISKVLEEAANAGLEEITAGLDEISRGLGRRTEGQ
ncbi:alpha-ketoacid dehydrogenase subunit alpha/beta [Nesterenkonia ebinurensis]|uniref:alpha-ketoacid dehydrogenase subunit alpha/beta n=1 Tax=Nesterenkonia ebinurensis TaxID=2608252 RepID=UPI00123DDAEF|nr:alpha-ketoacid dehydrogenase subunit alpha/beta [Nesterenkonia ebinurensis]